MKYANNALVPKASRPAAPPSTREPDLPPVTHALTTSPPPTRFGGATQGPQVMPPRLTVNGAVVVGQVRRKTPNPPPRKQPPKYTRAKGAFGPAFSSAFAKPRTN